MEVKTDLKKGSALTKGKKVFYVNLRKRDDGSERSRKNKHDFFYVILKKVLCDCKLLTYFQTSKFVDCIQKYAFVQ